jgi:uncharacterized protein YifN (PemK superfamily)
MGDRKESVCPTKTIVCDLSSQESDHVKVKKGRKWKLVSDYIMEYQIYKTVVCWVGQITLANPSIY